LFANLRSTPYQPEFLQFGKKVTFTKSFRWSHDFRKEVEADQYHLPKLDRGSVTIVRFGATADVRINERDGRRLLSLSRTEEERLRGFKIERLDYFKLRGESEGIDVLQNFTSSNAQVRAEVEQLMRKWEDDLQKPDAKELLKIEREINAAQSVLNSLTSHLDSWLVILLDTEEPLRYYYNHEQGKFVQGFLTLGGLAAS
jgi:hypothetical protein